MCKCNLNDEESGEHETLWLMTKPSEILSAERDPNYTIDDDHFDISNDGHDLDITYHSTPDNWTNETTTGFSQGADARVWFDIDVGSVGKVNTLLILPTNETMNFNATMGNENSSDDQFRYTGENKFYLFYLDVDSESPPSPPPLPRSYTPPLLQFSQSLPYSPAAPLPPSLLSFTTRLSRPAPPLLLQFSQSPPCSPPAPPPFPPFSQSPPCSPPAPPMVRLPPSFHLHPAPPAPASSSHHPEPHPFPETRLKESLLIYGQGKIDIHSVSPHESRYRKTSYHSRMRTRPWPRRA